MELTDDVGDKRPAKRARSETSLHPGVEEQKSCGVAFLSLPDGVLHQILLCLESSEMFALKSACRYFNDLTPRVAKEKTIARVGYVQAARWRYAGWSRRLPWMLTPFMAS